MMTLIWGTHPNSLGNINHAENSNLSTQKRLIKTTIPFPTGSVNRQ